MTTTATTTATTSVRRRGDRAIVTTMALGLVLTAFAGVAPLLDDAGPRLIAAHVSAGYPSYGAAEVQAEVDAYVAILGTVGALGVVGWVGALLARRSVLWGRIVSTTLLVIGTTLGLTALLITDGSGDTGLPFAIGILGVLPCIAGAVAVVLQWRSVRA